MTDAAQLRADLHVHSWHSTENGDLPFLKSRDCYSDPVDVYRTAKARGMDVVTITDHDSIDGCLELLSRMPGVDDFVIGEEVSTWLPDGDIEIHLGVYGMTEALHRDIQPLRRNVFDVIARLREAQVFFSLNHLLHFYRRQVPLDTYLRLLGEVPALEVRNGTMVPAHNILVERLVTHLRHSSTGPGGGWPAVTAGSDAHTLRRVGRTWTTAPGRTAAEFLDSLRNGLGEPGGLHGGTRAVAGDAYGVVARYCASLFGLGPSDHAPLHRAGCMAFSIVSLPGQFLPLLIPAAGKRRERRIVAEATRELEPLLRGAAAGIAGLDVSQEQA
jgi:predicted metal-dependent phosphoesterase TrpH